MTPTGAIGMCAAKLLRLVPQGLVGSLSGNLFQLRESTFEVSRWQSSKSGGVFAMQVCAQTGERLTYIEGLRKQLGRRE